ncbi:hypothetical protein SAY86_020550 [Trapa natans]|uniref:F-box domain-containing protein n=1 Tax=Trapa natans TaxID=22666 RepID=A0AAN7M3Q1_TRANT|nr:hypothetical protein SAY86_020550 [Trapa natans]
MLLYFFTCLSFILLLKTLSLKSLPSWASQITLVWLPSLKDLTMLPFSMLANFGLSGGRLFQIPYKMTLKKACFNSRVENVEEVDDEMSVLDLPELALECILERLPPRGLFSMAGVCSSLRKKCVSDYLWERHMKQKWGRLIGPAAYRVWKWCTATRSDCKVFKQVNNQRGLIKLLNFLPFTWIKSKLGDSERVFQPKDSIMSWYLSLETGKLWFPAQVYNRENGHVGFMMSCYDAELSYDSRTDTFQARYPPHGRRAVVIESGVEWDRLRTPPVDIHPRDLHISDCLSDLRPGDHIEIQWRRNKEFPYGWWYGVVGHLESCHGSGSYCLCHSSDTVVLQFNQYAPGSRWRQTTVDRRSHKEEGNEAVGFYGGIRKLENEDEISMWKQLWPAEILE